MHRKLAISFVAAAVLFSALPALASAHRFGPPWQARVVVDRTTVYAQPEANAAVVGPLDRGQLVVVVGETKAPDGTEWTQVTDGYLRSQDIAEDVLPWIAEVSQQSVSILARPNARDVIRKTARQGDLVRVTGVSAGVDGDTSTWWATTEGYLPLNAVKTSSSEWARGWTLPSADLAATSWWGAIRSQANVRAAPTTGAPIVGSLVPGDKVKVLSEEAGDSVGGNATWYRIDGGRYAGALVHSSLISKLPQPKAVVAEPPEPAEGQQPQPWIAVSRASATLTLFAADNTPQFTTLVSLGRAGVDTPQGDYGTIGKYRFDTMSSSSVADAEHAYHLPNVPFVEYYRDGGFAIHGTYWHDHFGQVESQGCINLTWADSAYLFNLTQPAVAAEDVARWAVGDLKATPLRILN